MEFEFYLEKGVKGLILLVYGYGGLKILSERIGRLKMNNYADYV